MSNLTELQRIELDILTEFKRVAERENLNWFIMFGTLLGAVRQKGFIPWDEDVDVVIERSEYNRLRKNPQWFSKPYFLQTTHNDPAGAPRFMRLRRSDTAYMEKYPNSLTKGGHMGVYIDILPLDDVGNGLDAWRMNRYAKQMQQQLLATAALDECGDMEVPDFKKLYSYGNGGVAGLYQTFADRYESIFLRGLKTPYCAVPVMSGERGGKVYEKEWFASSVTMEFEGLSVFAPIGWKESLIVSYPEGIYEISEKNREPRHAPGCIIDTKRSYKEYTRRYEDMLKDIKDKKVYIFGAGDSLRIWLERYSKGIDVVCAFDNSPSKWGKQAYGVSIRNPKELPELLDDDSRLITASIWHREIAKQLDKMGIDDYYVFIDGWNYAGI